MVQGARNWDTPILLGSTHAQLYIREGHSIKLLSKSKVYRTIYLSINCIISSLKRKSEDSDNESSYIKKGKHQASNNHDSNQKSNGSQSKQKSEILSDDESSEHRNKKQKDPEKLALFSALSHKSTPDAGPSQKRQRDKNDSGPPRAKRLARESVTVTSGERKKYHTLIRRCGTWNECMKILDSIPKTEMPAIALAFNDMKEEHRLLLAKKLRSAYVSQIIKVLIKTRLDKT